MIVVPDTGTWISAFFFGGVPLRAIQLVAEEHQIAICPAIIAEVLRVSHAKFGATEIQVYSNLSRFLADAVMVTTIGFIKGVCRDPDDDAILECAVMSRAGVIVTGDNDLLVLGTYEGIQIVKARSFLELYRY